MPRPRFRLGLRTVKTTLAVIISLFIASLFGELSIFPALASIAVMSRTFEEGLIECRNQAVGIFIGGVFGCVTATAFPDPPIWGIGLGILLIMVACASFNVVFSCSLSCAIFIVACMTEEHLVIINTLIRLFHTAIGLITGLLINYLIVPYNNSEKIYDLMEELLDSLPSYLDQSIFHHLYPDLVPIDTVIERLHYEMTIYRHQRFLRQKLHRDEYAYMSGCLQLAERIHQELTLLCRMDRTGIPDEDNLFQLKCLNLEIPESWPGPYICTEDEKTVTNYHLKKLLEARGFLTQMLHDRPQKKDISAK